jgi:hypothetical protein
MSDQQPAEFDACSAKVARYQPQQAFRAAAQVRDECLYA